MGKMSRTKGAAFQREIAHKISEHPKLICEVDARDGAANNSHGADLQMFLAAPQGVPAWSTRKTIECKKREDISKRLWEWLEGNDYLVIGRNRHQPLIVLPLSEWIKQVGGE